MRMLGWHLNLVLLQARTTNHTLFCFSGISRPIFKKLGWDERYLRRCLTTLAFLAEFMVGSSFASLVFFRVRKSFLY